MKSQPDAQYCARIMIDVFVQDFNCRVGNSLPLRSIGVGSRKRNLNESDVKSGVDYGIQEAWLERGPEGTFRLTQKGFDES